MKVCVCVWALWLGLLPFAWGQAGGVRVDLELDQEQYLPNETLLVAVRITNLSGQTLHLGNDQDWLTFSIEARDNFIVSNLGPVPVAGEFFLDSSRTGTKRVDISPYFDIRYPGRYRLTATVKIPQWEAAISSHPIPFDIIGGTRMKEFEFGVPLPPGVPPGPPEVRKYVLQQANYLKKLRLYVRVTDAPGSHTFRVAPIGLLVSFSKPEAQLDQFSNLHLLHQTGARSFNYCVVNPDGEIVSRQTHEYTDTRPVLRPLKEGFVGVVGGGRRPSATDVPPAPATPAPDTDAMPETP